MASKLQVETSVTKDFVLHDLSQPMNCAPLHSFLDDWQGCLSLAPLFQASLALSWTVKTAMITRALADSIRQKHISEDQSEKQIKDIIGLRNIPNEDININTYHSLKDLCRVKHSQDGGIASQGGPQEIFSQNFAIHIQDNCTVNRDPKFLCEFVVSVSSCGSVRMVSKSGEFCGELAKRMRSAIAVASTSGVVDNNHIKVQIRSSFVKKIVKVSDARLRNVDAICKAAKDKAALLSRCTTARQESSALVQELKFFRPERESKQYLFNERKADKKEVVSACEALFRVKIIELADLRTMVCNDIRHRGVIRGSGNGKVAFHAKPSETSCLEGSCASVEARVTVRAALYHGGQILADHLEHSTQPVQWLPTTCFNEWLEFGIQLCNIPSATRLGLSVFIDDEPLGWANVLLVGADGSFSNNMCAVRLWRGHLESVGTVLDNPHDSPPATLFFKLGSFGFITRYRIGQPPHRNKSNKQSSVNVTQVPKEMSPEEERQLHRIIRLDPLSNLKGYQKKLVWQFRTQLSKFPQSLPKLVLAVQWTCRHHVNELHKLVDTWGPVDTHAALQLLGPRYADPFVRAFAIKCLSRISDSELECFILQLVQVLKYETHHDSQTARFLLARALDNPLIGHRLFWHIKAELHVPQHQVRFGLFLSEYLHNCGSFKHELAIQDDIQKKFRDIADSIKALKDHERLLHLKDEIYKTSFPGKFRLPLDPRIQCSGVRHDRCRYMDSKKLPLWLCLKNADPIGDDITVIYKSGDDLRQDMLTLQMIKIMDQLWRSHGLDLCMSVYGAVATGEDIGMIEVVLQSESTSAISKAAGGATSVFREDPIAIWLREKNPTDEAYTRAVDNFIRSVAGYCVATCVLGVGDRHNDNIMLQSTGKLFHIDFGHFLGNFKSKFGIKRERAKFVFTPDFAYVMGGVQHANFARFETLCIKAFNILRQKAHLFITLFMLMTSSGIPELQSEDDILYMRDLFLLDKSDNDAGDTFASWIHDSLHCRMTQVNNLIHSIVH
mmetsp:Transcript_11174/g.38835  ORF Transcript_11174/g.38835 Transcript_11174/m.38835 type:complete len:1010 (-) Transcript_11174:885-3914(-)